MLTARLSPRFGWAFWALVMAWLCAQSPHTVLFEAASWAGGFARISHHDRLIAEVDRVVSSKGEIGGTTTEVVQTKSNKEPGKSMALPMGSLLGKLWLAVAARERLAGEEMPAEIFERAEDWLVALRSAGEPPSPPPRSV
ncbi:MAG: hypothetical protein QM760_20420 [Nibricoccus sp.]